MLSETKEYKKRVQRKYNVQKTLGREITNIESQLLETMTPNELFTLIDARDALHGIGDYNPLILEFLTK